MLRLLLLIALAACAAPIAEMPPPAGDSSATTIVDITVRDAADIAVDSVPTEHAVTSASVSLPLDDNIHSLKVTAPGYKAWTLDIKSDGAHGRRISGSVLLTKAP